MRMMQKTVWLICLGVLGVPVYFLNFKLAAVFAGIAPLDAGGTAYRSYLYQLVPLAVLYLAALIVVFQPGTAGRQPHGSLVVILVFAAVYRMFLVPAPPVMSTDIYRYIWDGRVQAHGINPYRYAPQDRALESLRDKAIHPRINRPRSRTIYPAGAQILFYALNLAGIRTPSSFKAVVSLFDMGSIWMLILILMRLKLPTERVLVYAWHPLVVYELSGSGHLDGVMLFFVLLALLFLLRDRPALSAVSLALAASLKLMPLVLLPALLTENKWRNGFLFGTVFLALYLPYLSVGKNILGFLPEYFSNPHEAYNLGIKVYLLRLFPVAGFSVITMALSAVLAAAAAAVWFVRKNAASAIGYAYLLAGLLFILAPGSVQPWYIVLVIPFLALFFSPAWLYFSLAICLSYLTFLSPGHTPPEWVRTVEYIPLYILLSLEYIAFFRLRRKRGPITNPGFGGAWPFYGDRHAIAQIAGRHRSRRTRQDAAEPVSSP
jgi:alpha-1,6-mannosyltransferase